MGEHAAVRYGRILTMATSIRYVALFAMWVLALLAPATVRAQQLEPNTDIQAKVCKVGDGDSVHLCFDKKEIKARLLGIDAPEYKAGNSDESQTYGKEARDILAALVLDKMVKVRIVELDQYDRPLVLISLGDKQINKAMVCEGHAYAYKGKGAPPDLSYRACETSARNNRSGFWALPENQRPEYPGKWKRKHRR